MNVFDNLKLCAYLFVADSFDNSTNVYEKFCPLIEVLLSQKVDNYISFADLKEEINKVYDLNISRATLTELINKLASQGKVKKLKSGIEVIGEHFDRAYFVDKSKKESEISELFTDFYKYLINNNYHIDQEECKELLCRFVFLYSYQLFDLLNKSTHIENNETNEFPPEFAEHLYNYLIECKRNGKETYNYFQRLHNGAVQATLLNFNPQKINEFSNKDLNIELVVLDSNFIMRILDLQTESDCLTAKDTLELLKKKSIKLVVLSETIYEITNTIKNFLD